MSGEEKKQSVRTKQVIDYSAKFGDFASSSLQLFSIWSKVLLFCNCILLSFYLN